jgi:hypothetical protein
MEEMATLLGTCVGTIKIWGHHGLLRHSVSRMLKARFSAMLSE